MFRSARLLRLAAPLAATLALAAPAAATSVEGLAVTIENRTTPALCIGRDNVALTLSSPQTRRFALTAAHPSYLPMLGAADAPAADLIACDGAPAAETPAQAPSRTTLYEDLSVQLVGTRRPGLFSGNAVPVRVGDREAAGVDTLELWAIRDGRAERVVVIEPASGVWRLRPLAPEGRGATAFGAGVVVGPIEGETPRTAIESIVFAPRTQTFQLAFVGGGGAAIRLATLDRERIALEVVFDRPVADRPFAAVRGDFVTRFAADLAEIAVREADAPGWREAPITAFESATATDLWAGRTTPSRHATSAPDLVLDRFEPL
ncbi:hypothetical protein [Salinarimonas sp.]|uniref:hypothetical protein n=1 Tax=Salinarimonas sp. TaxID=2766526 RepID=UPI0032D9A271